MLVDADKVDRALNFLATTDAESASRKGQVMRLEFMAECAESLAYQQLEGSVEDRKRAVKLIPEVQKAWDEYFTAVVNDKNLDARRKRAMITIDLFRTLEASRRQGNIT